MADKTTEHPLRDLTHGEIEAFHRDGAVLLKGLLSSDWVSQIEEGLDTAIAAPGVMSESLGTLRVDQFPASNSEPLMRLIDTSPVAEIVGRVPRPFDVANV